MGRTEEDRDLVLRSRTGDARAFGMLVRRYQRRVHALGLRVLGNGDEADDLVQETFLRVWRSLDRFDLERPLLPWLLRIATNRAMSMLEIRSRRKTEELDESAPAPDLSPEESTDRQRLHRRIREAAAELPDEQRTILALRAGDGLSYREIADVLDLPIGTVMSRLARARETMRKKVQR